ncbi:MAG: hypothetical protein J6L70_00945 [Alphaproteobacteria bacterium]|nr:hypothetical protein [Alphaproteobacteria bacterium]
MITPKFLQELISSPEYGDKNSETYKRATRYMNILYPGTVQFDATGRMMRPEYDMTLEQFYDAQHEIETEFESDKSEAEADVLDAYGDYFETIGFEFNIEEYVVPGTPIPVKVLMPNGSVSKKYLDTYELDIPEFKIAPKIWIWHSEHGENTCDECSGNDWTVYETQEGIPDIPVHPNCRCWVEEIELDKNGKKIDSKVYKGQKPETQKASDMKNILTDKFKNDVMAHEGIRKSPYTDSKGYLTIGIGKNIHKLNDFLKLDIINTNTGTELTKTEKQNIHSKMVSEINNGTFREYDYAHIQISPNQIYNQFNQQLEIAYNELNKKIMNFIDMPISVQQALLDMQFNMGNNRFSERYWPKLFEAIKNKDWKTAAKEASERKDVQKARREWTKLMFLNAN